MDESKSMGHDGISKTGFENETPHIVREKLQVKKEMKNSNDWKTNNITLIKSVVSEN